MILLAIMKNSDIIEKIELLSIYFSCFEQQIEIMNKELEKISEELKNIKSQVKNEENN